MTSRATGTTWSLWQTISACLGAISYQLREFFKPPALPPRSRCILQIGKCCKLAMWSLCLELSPAKMFAEYAKTSIESWSHQKQWSSENLRATDWGGQKNNDIYFQILFLSDFYPLQISFFYSIFILFLIFFLEKLLKEENFMEKNHSFKRKSKGQLRNSLEK